MDPTLPYASPGDALDFVWAAYAVAGVILSIMLLISLNKRRQFRRKLMEKNDATID